MKQKLLFTSMFALPMLVTAQTAPKQNGSDVTFLDEVIVTASKRAETLQDTSISVSVATADTLDKAQIIDIIDLQTAIPNLRIAQGQTASNTNFVIRGFGNGTNNIGIEPSVGVFIDGVYRSRSGAAISDLPDLERVEVISGPQSTLFGKNASAGVISVATPTPTGEEKGFVSASFGNHDSVRVKASYENALTEKLNFSVSGSINNADGFFNNAELDEELNERDRFSVRGQLFYTPNDDTRIRLIVDYDDLDEACCHVINAVNTDGNAALFGALGADIVSNDPSSSVGFSDVDARNEVSNSGVSLQIDHDYSNFTLTSITAYRSNEIRDDFDVDGSNLSFLRTNERDIEIDTFTQEIRLTSNNDNKLQWLVGAYYFDESIDSQSNAEFGADFRNIVSAGFVAAGQPPLSVIEGLVNPALVGTFLAEGTGSQETATLDNDSYSVFGQLDYALTDNLTGTIGINYTKDEKEFSIIQNLTEVRAGITLPPTIPVPNFSPNLIDIPNSVEDNSTDDDEITYTARLAWKMNENLNLYATYATGFKASSVDLSRDSAPSVTDFALLQAAGLAEPNSVPGSRSIQPEDTTVYEVGLKALFSRGSFNLALFDQEIENFQSAVFNGTGFTLVSEDEQTVKGAEFDLSLAPTDALSLNLRGTYLDAEDSQGEPTTTVSDIRLSLSAQYNFTLAGLNSYVRGDYLYVEDSPLVAGLSSSQASNEINMLNMSVGVDAGDGLSVSLWARNLNDDDFLWTAFPSFGLTGNFSGFRNAPRTYGISLRKDF